MVPGSVTLIIIISESELCLRLSDHLSCVSRLNYILPAISHDSSKWLKAKYHTIIAFYLTSVPIDRNLPSSTQMLLL